MMKLCLIDGILLEQFQDAQVIIKALLEENKALQEENASVVEKDLALQGAMQRIEGLGAIKEMYLNSVNALLNEIELQKVQEARLIQQIKKQQEQIRELKQNSRQTRYFEMAEENLRMATELEKLKRRGF